MKILVLSAFDKEMEILKRTIATSSSNFCNVGKQVIEHQSYKNHDLYFAYTGIGPVCTGVKLTALHYILQPDLVVFIGTAGGVQNHLKIGDLVLVNQAVDVDILNWRKEIQGTPFQDNLFNPTTQQDMPEVYSVGESFGSLKNISLPNIRTHVGLVGTTSYFPAPAFIYDTIKRMNILALDMESAPVFQTGWLLKINTMVIRAISNVLDDKGKDEDVKEAKVNLCAENLAAYTINLIDAL